MQKIVVFWGMTASGKSTMGKALAEDWGWNYYNTDAVRKQLAGLAPTEKRPDGIDTGIYTGALTQKTYAAMLSSCRTDLVEGHAGVILDGSYSRLAERQKVRALAEELGVACYFLYCYCDEEQVKARLVQRSQDPDAVSDGRWEIYLYQKQNFDLPGSEEGCLSLETNDTVEQLLLRVKQLIGETTEMA